MKVKKYRCELLCAITVLGMSFAAVEGAETPAIEWNDAAKSQVLNKNELAKVGAALPAWNIKQITWPSTADINAKSVIVDEEPKTSCMGWLNRFMKKGHLPPDLRAHLIAMKNWGAIRKESEQKRLCDVFIVRFKKGPHVIHVQESPYNVVIGVADGRIPMDSPAEHKGLVMETAALILNETLQPDPNSDLHLFEIVRDGSQISRVVWLTKSVGTIDKHGKKCANLTNASKNGAIDVQAETNGIFVKFNIIKCVEGPKSYLDPYVQRFDPEKSMPSSPEGNGK
jgi:hypothetical protein